MNCDQIQEQLDAWLDGELKGAQAECIAAHIESCLQCSSQVDELRKQHQQLVMAFQAARQGTVVTAERVAARLPRQTVGAVRSVRPWQMLWSAVAGFLVAVLLFQPWSQRIARTIDLRPGSNPFAALTVATGPVEITTDATEGWRLCSTASPIPFGFRLRTDARQRCEVRISDHSLLRLDTDTEVVINSPNEFSLINGRVWCRGSRRDGGLSVKAKDVLISVRAGACNVVEAPQSTRVDSLQGDVSIMHLDQERSIEPGQTFRITGGEVEPEIVLLDPIQETRWFSELLLRKGADDVELHERVNRLWAEIGNAKMMHLYEEELRALGDGCSQPLLAYLFSSESAGEQARRSIAASIVADLCSQQFIPQLVRMLGDSNPQVRVHGARGLKRLTGKNMGVNPNRWRQMSAEQLADGLRKWDRWLVSQQDRFPQVATNKTDERVRVDAKTLLDSDTNK